MATRDYVYMRAAFIRLKDNIRAAFIRGRRLYQEIRYWHFRLFSHNISRTQSFQQNRQVIIHALVALKLLVLLRSSLIACSARIVVNKQTNRQTDTHNFCNPRCVCAPRVNQDPLCQSQTCAHSLASPRL